MRQSAPSTIHIRPLAVARALALLTALAASPTWANTPPPAVVAEDLQKKAAEKLKEKEAKDGWKRKLSVGATGSATSSTSVVGAVDGTTTQVGLLLDGESTLTSGSHEWQTVLKLQHARTRTPVMDAWVKSQDNLEIQSTWTYRLGALPWVGPFARAKLQTQVTTGYDVRPTDVNVVQTAVDGSSKTVLAEAESDIDLTSPFEPIVVAETAGAFAKPIEGKKLNLDIKLGVGGQHIFARGGYALTGFDAPTATVKVKEIETSHQVGGEGELEAKGELNELVKWRGKARLFLPLVTASEQAVSGAAAMTTEISATLSVKLAKWASLDYVLNVRRLPLVLRDWQVQHGLLLTTGFNVL